MTSHSIHPARVHLIFKTHLDVGFTDFAATVMRKYCEHYIPLALALSCELRDSGRPERFIWTTGSWLIYEYLEQADAGARRRMEAGIAAGDIAWHALPFTIQSELMDASLFRFGLSLARTLDRRFGRHTIAAKMTDVPGHCRAIVPLLAEAGVRFLHIGVNPACTPPRVPPVFRWCSADGSELLVAYSTDYGSAFRVPGLRDGLLFAHTGDNLGPPTAAAICKSFDECRAAHPGATVVASTLDAFARRLLPCRKELPVVTDEIGDTWIHGVGSDPRKVAEYRALCRLRNEWEKNGLAQRHATAFNAASRHLLVVPEHTWGLDEKTHLGDYKNYSAADFARARKRDLVPPTTVTAEYSQYAWFRQQAPFPQRYSTFASSWNEQRGYVRAAVRALAGTPLGVQARTALRRMRPTRPVLKGFRPLAEASEFTAGGFRVRFDRRSGAIVHLRALASDTGICTPAHPLGLFRYQTLSQADYACRLRQYAIHVDRHGIWVVPDLTKPGMDTVRPRPRHAFFSPVRAQLFLRRGKAADTVLARLALPLAAYRGTGAPREVWLRYGFPHDQPTVELELTWFDKPAMRLPEAMWLSFMPRLKHPREWRIEKMGEWFSPLEVIKNGNRNLHALGRDMRCGAFAVETFDAPLVAPGTPRLLEFDNVQPDLTGGMHVNLYNNVWGTNYPMWYEEDARFRFAVRVGEPGTAV